MADLLAPYQGFIAAASIEFKVPPQYIRGLIRKEAFDPHTGQVNPNAVGDGGLAVGLMQMHPTACQAVGFDWNRMREPEYAIRAGTAYLAHMRQLFPHDDDWSWALAAYHWGPTFIAKTRAYGEDVRKLMLAA